ncbi:MAG TPA: hypothetical protein DCP97_00910 [Ruminococcaceae bacterium]|nr:hypothetical protein [Oscillospiraceae bacterium]
MTRFESFTQILQEQISLYKSLLAVEKNKFDVIVAQQVGHLEDIINQEQALIMKSELLEQNRIQTQVNLGYGTKTLKQLIAELEPDKSEILLALYNELMPLVMDVKFYNDRCQSLVQIRLHDIERNLSAISAAAGAATYKNDGKKTAPNYSNSVLIKSV